jgi:hypothetical protein
MAGGERPWRIQDAIVEALNDAATAADRADGDWHLVQAHMISLDMATPLYDDLSAEAFQVGSQLRDFHTRLRQALRRESEGEG